MIDAPIIHFIGILRYISSKPENKVTARCKYIAESGWKKRRYLDVSMLEEMST